MERRIFGIGESVLDIVFRDGKVQTAVPGGSTFNSMVSLGRSTRNAALDCKLHMLTETGDDAVGEMIISFMEANGIDSSFAIRRSGRQTPISIALLDGRADARYEFFRDPVPQSIGEGDLPELSFRSGDILLFGSFFSVNPANRAYVSSLLKAASAAGAQLYYDVNFRPNHLKSLPVVRESILQNIALADYVRMSSDDIKCVFGTDDVDAVLAGELAGICNKLIITRGAGPATIYAGDYRASFEADKITPVSTIGAGDNFNAGFVYSILTERIAKGDSISGSQWGKMFACARSFSSNVCMSLDNYVDEDFLP